MNQTESNQYQNYEVKLMLDANLPFMVIEKIKATNSKNAEVIGILHFDWPDVEKLLEKFAKYITEGIVADGQPVILSIIESALLKYSSCVITDDGVKIKDGVRLGIFIEQLLSETCVAACVEIESGSGNRWDLCTGVPYSEWFMENTGGLSIRKRENFTKDETLYARQAMYSSITIDRIKTVLKRVNYEQAVVFGGNSSSA